MLAGGTAESVAREERGKGVRGTREARMLVGHRTVEAPAQAVGACEGASLAVASRHGATGVSGPCATAGAT